jgi:putative tryptophan/tyrosine transport system substrate-binding protein
MAHPGGNVTGLSIQQTALAAKKLELLREAVPSFRQLALLANVARPASALEKAEVEAGARTLSLDVVAVEIRRAEEIVPAFVALKGRAEALYVCGDALITNNRIRIITLALGARPKYETVINLKTAKALGLEIPPTLLARADEVIE